MDTVADHLRQVELFSKLKARDLRRLAGLFERARYDQDDYLTHQGETGDRFFIIESGRATVWHTDSAGVEQPVRFLEPGDSFGVTALFLEDPGDATVQVAQNSVVLSLERSRFAQHLEDFPTLRDALLLPEGLREQLGAPRFSWMTPDEYTLYYARKTRWALLSAEFLPALIFVTLMAAAAVLRNWPTLPAILSLLAALIGGAFAFLRWQDWRNDYYVVTNKRVLHYESHVPTLRVTVDQAPLHQIQNVTTLKPNPASRALNYGDLVIQTAGRGGVITFRSIDNPERCQTVLVDLSERVESLAKASERTAIRQAISERLRPPQEGPAEASEPEPATASSTLYTSGEVEWDLGAADLPAPDGPSGASALAAAGNRLLSFLPHFREEDGPVVTWYKHPFVLLKAIAMPALILTATLLGGVVWAAIGGKRFGTVVLALFVTWCLGLFWLLWQYEDWRNDIFQMTASHIIDIDRLPLGFRESKRQASLEQVQNINVDIPNVWARLFNYGNVVIETAGAAGDLTFEWVMRPRAVQREIFDRIDATRARRRSEEARQRRDEMANWLAVYHQMKEQDEI